MILLSEMENLFAQLIMGPAATELVPDRRCSIPLQMLNAKAG